MGIMTEYCCDGLLQETESTGRQQEERQSPEETGV